MLRVRVLSRLAASLTFSPFADRRAALSRQAVEMARRLGDTTTLALALSARNVVLWGPDTPTERLALATESVQLAETVARQDIAIEGHFLRLISALELGDVLTTDVEIRTFIRLAEELRQPFCLWPATVLHTMQALRAGRFTEAEHLAQEALALGQRAQSPNAMLVFGVHFTRLQHERGRVQEITDTIKSMVETYPTIPAWRAVLTFFYSELGRTAEARSEFERLAAQDFIDFPRNQEWLVGMANFADVTAFLGDTHRAALLYEMLLPYAERNVVAGPAVDCYGSVSRYLGRLATTLSHWEAATRHFTKALAMDTRLGAKPFVARTQYEYASMLLVRGLPEQREQAQALLDSALTTTTELGMKRLEEQITAAVASYQLSVASYQPLTPNPQL
ncbi:MAG: tetratricopeptide repeat protein [Candidatus Binatia bacterium]